MKIIGKIGLFGLSAGVSLFFAGCATKIAVDYPMPAREISDVKKVDVAAIRVKASVKGNLADANSNKAAAGLVKQLLSMRLCKEGYYRVTDDIWSTPEGAAAIKKAMEGKGDAHGYADFMAEGQGDEKVVIDLDLNLALNASPKTENREFTLYTVPYVTVDKKGKPLVDEKTGTPYSIPGAPMPRKEMHAVTIYEIAATGSLQAKFVAPNGKTCPLTFGKSYPLAMPAKDKFDAKMPSQLAALAAAVSPAIDSLVCDISPHKGGQDGSKEIEVASGGDDRVRYLLEALAFGEVVTVAEKLELVRQMDKSDYVNKGIACEALGDFFSAKESYEKALALEPEYDAAQEGLERVKVALNSKKAMKAQGAKQNKDTQFSK